MNPNHAMAYHGLGYTYAVSGRAEEAVPYFDRALRLSPQDPYAWAFLTMKAMSLMMCRRYDEAIEVGQRAIQARPDVFWAYFHVTCAYAHSGKIEEAKETFVELRKLVPNFGVDVMDETVWFKHKIDRDYIVEALRLAGMEE